MRRLIIGLAATAALAAGAAQAAPAKKAAAEPAPYGRDLVSVATPGRTAAAPTADCVVWANAEGLGVGPAQLDGLHGVVMHLNEKPLPNETATTFAAGLADLKAVYPGAPAWLAAAIEKNRAAIETRCAEDHPEPFVIHKLTAADKR